MDLLLLKDLLTETVLFVLFSVPAEDSVKKYSLREAVYQRKLKAARKCIYLSH